ncbi:alkaline ceramidase 2-like [Hyalella azteca]|uniref:Alkaline ceramidase n=1 Tax=Hyalella azteca TaxID=294128 RepID=A0A8B7NCD4_HYAAZ|nr:alkaline ceramidase 2-like [Hyalella azteca]
MVFKQTITEKWLAAGSSPVDWCEENYTVSSSIAEFTNSLSNVLTVIIPAYCIKNQLWRSYRKHISNGPQVILYLTALIGIASAYFHGTLSLFGQLLDEVWIIWVMCVAYASLTADCYRPVIFRGSRANIVALFLATFLTLMWFVAPYTNAFWMMTMGAPVYYFLYNECFVVKRKYSLSLVRLSLVLNILGITFWVADRAMCNFWLSLGLPGLHNIWHLLCGVGSYLNLTVFAYLKAASDAPYLIPTIRYYPGDTWGLPYVHCKSKLPS